MIATCSITPPGPRIVSPTETTHEWRLEGCLGETSELTETVVDKNPFSIGRNPDVDFRLPSRNVSKLHVDLVLGGETVFVRDLGSSNGTFVNGIRIAQATPIGDGDLLQFADMEFRLRRRTAVAPEHTHMSDRPEDGWLISRLYQVVNERRFTMAFQPIVCAQDKTAVGYEALVRCQVPGLESPLKLFEAAARLHQEERVSVMCREEAVRLIGDRHPKRLLFVNTHANEYLGPELIDSLKVLNAAACGRQIVLEVHEAAVPDLDTMRSFRGALNEIGVQLAYDDFGAGQSRLMELTEVPPDYLKFDRGLLKDLPTASPNHRSLVQTLVSVSTDLGIATIAEGLDNQETVDICCDMGFSHLQGFHLARPMMVDSL